MTQLLPGSALSVSELDAAMAAMDADGDGAVSFAELQGWLHAQGESFNGVAMFPFSCALAFCGVCLCY